LRICNRGVFGRIWGGHLLVQCLFRIRGGPDREQRFPIFIEGEHEVKIPGGRVGSEFSIGRVPDEEKEVEEELGEGGTSRFEKGVGYARRPSAFVGGEVLNVVNDFREGGRFGLG